MKHKVLITTNPLDHEGGVVNYYRLFLKNFKSDIITPVHLVFGSRMEHFYSPWKKRILYPVLYCFDFLRFVQLLLTDQNIRIVQVSPSLIPIPLIRDAFIVLLAKLLNRSVIVFYRGWDPRSVRVLKSNMLIRQIFIFFYSNVDITIVLASRFKENLIEFGWKLDSIKLTTTMYKADDVLPTKDRSKKQTRLLFLGRVSRLKGMGELIESAKLLANSDVDFKFLVVGHGDKDGILEDYQAQVDEANLENHIFFTGRLTGKEKWQAYRDSDIYVFPSLTEGCPTSVLEALGAGLFVVSTDVGALRDIISDKNGKIVPCRDYIHLADTLNWACKNIEAIRKQRKNIQTDALNRYESKIIFQQFNDIYQSLLTRVK